MKVLSAQPHIAAMAAYPLSDPTPQGWISLAQNESAFGPSAAALQAAIDCLGSAAFYPDPDWRDLRQAIADVHDIPVDQILCGAGSMELIGALFRAFIGPGDAVIGSQYGYLFAETACQQIGARYLRATEVGMIVCPDALLEIVTPETKIVFLCNPGNPTGTRIANERIVALRKRLPPEIILVVDQAYAEFDTQDARPVFDLVQVSNTAVLRTFSKAYALAGARVGWGLFPHAIAAELRKLLNPNNISCMSQAMARAAVMDQTHMQGLVSRTADLRGTLQKALSQAGYKCPESQTNFVLIPFADMAAARRADRRVREEQMLLRNMSGYGLPECLRATIGTPDAMARLASALAAGPKA